MFLPEAPGAGCDTVHRAACMKPEPAAPLPDMAGNGGASVSRCSVLTEIGPRRSDPDGSENYPAFIRMKLPSACRFCPASVGLMCTKYDPQHEAEAAMKRAAASEGDDRQRLIQLALAWHQLARDRRDEDAD